MNCKLGFIGGGNMASSLIGGLVSSNGDLASDSMAAKDIMVYEPNADQAKNLAQQFAIQIADSNQQLVEQCDIIIVAVKPQLLAQVFKPLAASFKQHQPLIVSIVAGISIASMEQWLAQPLAVVRVMPNTPALVGAGASGLYANERVTQQQKQQTQTLLNAVGSTAWVAQEKDIDSVTALSGSGPAYFMLFIQGLIDSAVKSGLEPETAKQLAVDTAIGAGKLIQSSELPLQTLIDNVTSPGGTTEQALKSFKQSGLVNIVEQAFDAAKNRSHQLADELSQAGE